MVRISKQQERRNVSPRRPRPPAVKSGPKPEKVGFRPHANAVQGDLGQSLFIAKIK